MPNVSWVQTRVLFASLLNLRTDDGYRLGYGGYDYLALHTYQKQKNIYSVGNQIGMGKESDIVVVADSNGTQLVLKIHRLGRISFRTVKNNRDYLRKRSSGSWMYMSRLAALKEFAFMKALHEYGLPVPIPIAQNRHTLVMSLIEAFPLRQISTVPAPATLYAELIELILRLAGLGLIHGDFNEFNILIKEEETPQKGAVDDSQPSPTDTAITLVPILIDFPQMVSIDHPNAEMYFDRDVKCIKRFFERRFHFVSDEPGPFFSDAKNRLLKTAGKRLDVEVEASGFSKKMAKELDAYMKEVGVDCDRHTEGDLEDGGADADDVDEDDEEEGFSEELEDSLEDGNGKPNEAAEVQDGR